MSSLLVGLRVERSREHHGRLLCAHLLCAFVRLLALQVDHALAVRARPNRATADTQTHKM